MVLNVATAEDFDEIAPSVRLKDGTPAHPERNALAHTLEAVVAVEFLVLVPAMCCVLVGRHESVESRQRRNLAKGADHCRFATAGDRLCRASQRWADLHGRGRCKERREGDPHGAPRCEIDAKRFGEGKYPVPVTDVSFTFTLI
jgi:hypothetical protein